MIPMLITLLPALIMYQINHMEELISLLMHFTMYIHFPLGTHLLQGMVISQDFSLGHTLTILGLPSQLEGMMVLSSCLLKSISY